jgi:hypothetical protein
LCIIVFINIAIVTDLFSSDNLLTQTAGALLEAVITALITYFLLTGQTTQAELKDRQMKVFEKKQGVYHGFLKKLESIIQDGEIKIGHKKEDGTIDRTIDDLKDLIFQLGYLQMHTSEDTINGVLNELVKMIQYLNDYNSEEQKKQINMPDFYSSLSNAIFTIVSILKKDLYEQESKPIEKEQMSNILKECNLFVETKEFDKIELQQYFWDELRKQLKNKGYEVDMEKNFKEDIVEYYARARNRHRYYGIIFEVYKLKDNTPVEFAILIENGYYYGFGLKNNVENNEIKQWFKDNMTKFQLNNYPDMYGWRWPSPPLQLDFWNLTPKENFDTINNPRKREGFIVNLADEIDMYIKDFQKKAKESNI